MNIWGLKKRLRNARGMLRNSEEELSELFRKKRKRRDDFDKIGELERRIKKVRGGMNNLKNKIKPLKNERNNKKSN